MELVAIDNNKDSENILCPNQWNQSIQVSPVDVLSIQDLYRQINQNIEHFGYEMMAQKSKSFIIDPIQVASTLGMYNANSMKKFKVYRFQVKADSLDYTIVKKYQTFQLFHKKTSKSYPNIKLPLQQTSDDETNLHNLTNYIKQCLEQITDERCLKNLASLLGIVITNFDSDGGYHGLTYDKCGVLKVKNHSDQNLGICHNLCIQLCYRYSRQMV